MRRLFSAILMCVLTPVLTDAVRAEKGAMPSPGCKSQQRIVENLEGILERGGRAGIGGDPEKSYQIYRQAARTILEGQPDCEDIRHRLEDALERTGTMGRSTDRAEELKRCFDGILGDYAGTPAADMQPGVPGNGKDQAARAMEAYPGDDADADDAFYWLSDPYFLFLELILLGILYLLREVKRTRQLQRRVEPLIRPFKFRELPDRPPPRKSSGSPRSGHR